MAILSVCALFDSTERVVCKLSNCSVHLLPPQDFAMCVEIESTQRVVCRPSDCALLKAPRTQEFALHLAGPFEPDKLAIQFSCMKEVMLLQTKEGQRASRCPWLQL